MVIFRELTVSSTKGHKLQKSTFSFVTLHKEVEKVHKIFSLDIDQDIIYEG